METEALYCSLKLLAQGVQALASVADDWCEEDRSYALVKLLADNLNHRLIEHQQAVYKSLAMLEHQGISYSFNADK
ncbi:hypothetical protein [Shewanella algae]|uniref:hypothetical protein n=1 Tax=Shewanella algae TaxID=38313 RepID=UPI001F3FFFAE|nr:hypothetical protein [Shewanella algae]MCE9775487.1 hypothetical protein [Shewanella algae]